MSKILLAIDNEYIYGSIIKNKQYDFFEKDIVYKEGVIEVLEKNPEINFLIINNCICGCLETKDFITKIKEIRENIKIVIYINKYDEYNINFFNSKGIYQIYKIEDMNVQEIKEILENNFAENEKINSEISYLKRILKKEAFSKNIKSKLIVFWGEKNVGKTIFSTTTAQIVEEQKKKAIIISFDIYKKDLSILLNCDDVVNRRIKVNSMLDIIYIDEKNKLDISLLEKEYEYIIIDSSNNSEIIKCILIKKFKIFFIVESTILGVNKARLLLENFINKYVIDVDCIEIIFNRCDKRSISKYILKEIFEEYKILGFCKDNMIKKFIKRKITRERSNKCTNK